MSARLSRMFGRTFAFIQSAQPRSLARDARDHTAACSPRYSPPSMLIALLSHQRPLSQGLLEASGWSVLSSTVTSHQIDLHKSTSNTSLGRSNSGWDKFRTVMSLVFPAQSTSAHQISPKNRPSSIIQIPMDSATVFPSGLNPPHGPEAQGLPLLPYRVTHIYTHPTQLELSKPGR